MKNKYIIATPAMIRAANAKMRAEKPSDARRRSVTVAVSDAEKERLELVAVEMGCTVSDIMRRAMLDILANYKNTGNNI